MAQPIRMRGDEEQNLIVDAKVRSGRVCFPSVAQRKKERIKEKKKKSEERYPL